VPEVPHWHAGTGQSVGVVGLLILVILVLFFFGALVWTTTRRRRGSPVLARSGTAFVPLQPHDCYRALTEILPDCLSVKSTTYGPSEDKIEVRTRMGIRSFGEDIEVVAMESDGGSIVSVLSMPALWPTVIDYGKNTENVRVILDALLVRCGGQLLDTSR
jgi:hypothetical protein